MKPSREEALKKYTLEAAIKNCERQISTFDRMNNGIPYNMEAASIYMLIQHAKGNDKWLEGVEK